MERHEVRVRLLEAAARLAAPHKDGYAVGALEMARMWEAWAWPDVNASTPGDARAKLGLPAKK